MVICTLFLAGHSLCIAARSVSTIGKQKMYVAIEPFPDNKPEIYTATITASLITAHFIVPKLGTAGNNLAIEYQLSGLGLAAVEATAFENPKYLSRWVYTTSAFPKEMEIVFNYLGAMQTKKSGEYSKSAIPKLTNRFRSNRYYRLLFEIRNVGRTLLKSFGFGKITYRLDVVNLTDMGTVSGILLTPKSEMELYPGEKQTVSYLIPPLSPGEYLIKLLAYWNETQIIAETNLSVTVIDQEVVEWGAVLPERVPHPTIGMFSTPILSLQEPLHAYRIHEITDSNNPTLSGILLLSMPEKDCAVIVRLLTPSQIATASFQVSVKKPKKKKRV
ncbi:MAG: hypothetical protein N3A72_05295 [bacterium]|nr:hypothetical protein [bacterium]